MFRLKKLDLRGASRPPSILIRRRPSNTGRETPRTPALSDLGSGAISWNRYPGRDHYPLGWETVTPGRARLTTQPKLSGAQREGFFPISGEIRPGGGSNPPPVECRRLLRTNWANNLRQSRFWRNKVACTACACRAMNTTTTRLCCCCIDFVKAMLLL